MESFEILKLVGGKKPLPLFLAKAYLGVCDQARDFIGREFNRDIGYFSVMPWPTHKPIFISIWI